MTGRQTTVSLSGTQIQTTEQFIDLTKRQPEEEKEDIVFIIIILCICGIFLLAIALMVACICRRRRGGHMKNNTLNHMFGVDGIINAYDEESSNSVKTFFSSTPIDPGNYAGIQKNFNTMEKGFNVQHNKAEHFGVEDDLHAAKKLSNYKYSEISRDILVNNTPSMKYDFEKSEIQKCRLEEINAENTGKEDMKEYTKHSSHYACIDLNHSQSKIGQSDIIRNHSVGEFPSHSNRVQTNPIHKADNNGNKSSTLPQTRNKNSIPKVSQNINKTEVITDYVGTEVSSNSYVMNTDANDDHRTGNRKPPMVPLRNPKTVLRSRSAVQKSDLSPIYMGDMVHQHQRSINSTSSSSSDNGPHYANILHLNQLKVSSMYENYSDVSSGTSTPRAYVDTTLDTRHNQIKIISHFPYIDSNSEMNKPKLRAKKSHKSKVRTVSAGEEFIGSKTNQSKQRKQRPHSFSNYNSSIQEDVVSMDQSKPVSQDSNQRHSKYKSKMQTSNSLRVAKLSSEEFAEVYTLPRTPDKNNKTEEAFVFSFSSDTENPNSRMQQTQRQLPYVDSSNTKSNFFFDVV